MVQRGGGARFTAEAFKRCGIFRDFARQELQRDGPAEINIFGLEDHTHPAAAKLFQDSKMRDCLADHAVNKSIRTAC